LLPLFRFSQEVVISRKEGTVQGCGTVEQFVIWQLSRAILLSRPDIHSSPCQSA
jgi:hypothetical protein